MSRPIDARAAALPSWEHEQDAVCARIASNHAALKIVLKTKDEADLLQGWIDHHSSIVGPENLVIFDNGSSDPAVYAIYDTLSDRAVIVSFRGFHHELHRTPTKFRALYDALRRSADYYTLLDTDERMIWTEDASTYKRDASIPDRIRALGGLALPSLWPWNVAGYHDRFQLFDPIRDTLTGLNAGKIVLSAEAPLSRLVCHNSEADPAVFDGLERAHLLVLHLKNLSPKRRVRVNIRKLRQRGVIGPNEGVEAVLALDPDEVSRFHGAPRQHVAEVRRLVSREEPAPSSHQPLAKGQIKLEDDGTITFFDEEDQKQFAAFQRDPFPAFARAIGLSTATRNPLFRGWADMKPVVVENDLELCDDWFVQLSPRPKPDDPVHAVAEPANPGHSPASRSGMRLKLPRPYKWVRVYQPWAPPAGAARFLEVATGFDVQPPMRLEWVAILREELDGKRVIARQIADGRLDTAGLSADERYVLAVQFAGGPGEVTLERCCAFPAPERPTKRARATRHVSAGKAVVVGWELGNNSAGRSFLLAELAGQTHDTQLVGPLFAGHGGRLWSPLRGQTDMRIRTFRARDLATFARGARQLAERLKCDVVHVSKARLPSLLLGALIKRQNGCPLVVDVDERERSFFREIPTPSLADLAAAADAEPERIDKPHSDIWTAYSETLICSADAVTVSNVALQDLFGGTIVRHARDERLFDPKLYDRAAVRREFGYGPDDRVVLFLGTPRPHKGIFEIADAMEWLDLRNLAFCVIGSTENERISSRFLKYTRARIARHPNQPWERIPELVAMADAVMLPQDPRSRIAAHQIPAKLTDALAMGVPVYATPTPPLHDLIEQGVVRAIPDGAALGEALRDIAEAPERPADPDRTPYLDEFSYRVNAQRLAAVFEQVRALPPRPRGAIDEVLGLIERWQQ